MRTDSICTKQNLIDHIERGNKVKYLFFWGHQKGNSNSITKSCFSQWYEASFELDGNEASRHLLTRSGGIW